MKISRPYEKQVAELLARFVNNGPEGIPNVTRLDAGTQAELKKYYHGHLSSFKGQVSTRCTECNEKAHVMLATESDKLWAKFITLLAQVRLILERHLTLLIPQGQVASV